MDMNILKSLFDIYFSGDKPDKETNKSDDIKSATFNKEKGVTTVVLRDGRKGIAKVSKDDIYDERVGMALAYCYAVFGSKTQFNKKIEKIKAKQKK
jgi:hypothetical protein